jgi:hypothetical protein
MARWLFAAVLTMAFPARVVLLQGWYFVTYILGLPHLLVFALFVSPKVQPALDYEDEGPELPTMANEEFRPFIRRLPEFKFWYSLTYSTVIAWTLLCLGPFFSCFSSSCSVLSWLDELRVWWISLPPIHTWETELLTKGHEDSGKSENVSLAPGAVREEWRIPQPSKYRYDEVYGGRIGEMSELQYILLWAVPTNVLSFYSF